MVQVAGFASMASASPELFASAILPTLSPEMADAVADYVRTAALAARTASAREVSDKFVTANRDSIVRKFLPWGRVRVDAPATPEVFVKSLDEVCAYIREFGRSDEVNGTHVLKFTHVETGSWAEVPDGQRGAVRVGGMALTITARDIRGYVDPITAAELDAAVDGE